MQRTLFEAEHEEFRELLRTFVTKECQPHHEEWERAGVVDRSAWRRAGEMGLLGLTVPEQYGGAGLNDPRYDVIVTEELAFGGITGLGLSLHNELLAPYLVGLTSDAQKARWLRGYCSGETVTAIAMSEPGASSDLRGIRTTAIRDGDRFVVNGAKTFISNGLLADLVVVAVKTDPAAGRSSLSLLAVERAIPGFAGGRKLDKVGLRAQDTAELFFDDARVPATNLLGEEHRGLHYLMRNLAAERLSIAVGSVASARRAQELTRQYVRSRTAFGTTIGSFQNTRFVLAALHARTLAVQALVDGCVQARIAGTLTPQDAAAAKLLATELEFDAVDAGVQLHGGYGWMEEYPIARMYRDVRITRIFGGSSEIMKEVVGRALRLDDPTAP